ncbi:beta strand repeat-containing protein, partial [Tsuneonella sp. SYSU-LHT278]|uniref:beta strand repeat-containing protein n=1 Tax=Tsuneonella sediminis TaxID=3416089 RepID=UPI003F796D81
MELHNSEPGKFGAHDANELQDSQNAGPAAPAGAGSQVAVTRVLSPDEAGTVMLPAGTELGDIRIEGRDLVIVGADGVRYVIPDGAIIVPQLVIDDVAIPPLNLAALLVGNEPQPAAGNPQSSGGNFASAVGPIQAAYGLGDLLPYTELNFPQPEEREIIPAAADREPTITIITVDQPVGAQSATATVAESGLPARGGEPAGTNAAAPTEITSGTIVFASPDGVASITINGVPFTGVGQVISSPRGDLLITSFDPVAGTIGFTYTLTDNLVGGTVADEFTVSVTDTDGDVATATLTVSASDDAPIARNDTDAVAAGSYAAESGNVVTAAGTTSGPSGADTPGADGAAVSRIASNNVPANTDTTFDASGNLQVSGQYGTLLIKADGSYVYTRAAGTPGGVADAFTYTLTDADGSTSTATLTINIADASPTITTLPPAGSFESGTLVFEAGLPARPGEAPGSNAAAPTETTSGSITFTGGDGPLSATINGVTAAPGAVVTIPGVGTLTVNTFNPATGVLTYSFTLADNTSGDNTSATFTVVVTDVDGDSAPGTFVIAIRDDTPQAAADSATQAVENAPVTVNVLANDVPGADSVQPSTVQLVPGSLSGTGTLSNNGDGTFTYAPAPGENGPVTFDYSITDGDGDVSTATVTIVLVPDSSPVVGEGANLSVDEDGLPGANADAVPLQADPAETAAGDNPGDSGTVTVDFGGDVPVDLAASIVLLDDPAYDGQLRTLDGDPVTFAIEGGALIGRDSAGAEVIRVTVTGAAAGPNPGQVIYTYSTQLSQPVQHAVAGSEDSVTLAGVTFRVTDLDGDSATGTFSVSVSDDVPSALDEAGGSLAEGSTVSGTLDFVAGADGATVTAIDGTPLVFGTDGFSQAVTLFDATDTIPVGTIRVKADGTYSFTAADPLANPVVATATFTVTDRDGDSASAAITFTVTDANAPTGGTAQAALDDDGLTGGNPASTTFDLATDAGDALADNDETTFAGTLAFADGGDAPATITFAAGVDGSFAVIGTERVQYTVSGDTLTATVAPQDAGGAAQDRAGLALFTVQITDANTGTYLVTLVNNVLHAGGPNEENPVGADAVASIAFTVTDGDGSTASATLAITFDDDAPTASAVSVTQATENAAFMVDITGSYAAGADGVDLSKVTWTQPAQGTVTYDGAGHFTYTPNAGAGSDSVGDSFTFTVVDGDGDTATATVSITLQPDSAPVAIDAFARIDDDGLPAGNAASNPAGTDDDQNTGEAGAGIASEAVWTGSLAVQAGANDTPLTFTLASAAGSGTVGTEAVEFTYDEMSHTLTATVAAGEARAGTVLFTVTITDVNSGAYTVTLVNPIRHPSLDGDAGDDTENNVSVALTFTVSDSDPAADSDTGILTIDFDDDTPTASAVSATQGSENAAFDIPLAGQFDAGADGLASITFTQPSQGSVVLNGTTFTYTPASGAGSDGNTSDSFTFTVTDADGDSVTKTVNVTLQPDSVPVAGTPTGLAVDEDGLAGANADDGQTDPAEVTGTGSASDLTGSVVVDYGDDVPADLLGSVALVDLAGYDTQLRTLDGQFVTFGLEL